MYFQPFNISSISLLSLFCLLVVDEPRQLYLEYLIFRNLPVLLPSVRSRNLGSNIPASTKSAFKNATI